MKDVEELVISPFREVVEKGKLAVLNAGESSDMLKAAQSLVKVGERGLTRIEASCKKLYNEYGINFVIALKENDELSSYRGQLMDLLWDFDDYLEAETFDADKFKELQALSRDAAPKVYNILITLKLKAPLSNHFLSQLSPPSSPQPQSLSPIQTLSQNFGHVSSSARGSLTGSEDAGPHLQSLVTNRSSSIAQNIVPDPDLAPQEHESLHDHPPDEPPRPPSVDPWDPHEVPYTSEEIADNNFTFDRREPVFRPESPVDPAISPMAADLRPRLPSHSQQSRGSVDTNLERFSSHGDHRDHRPSTSSMNSSSAPSYETRSRATTFSDTIPEEDSPRRESRSSNKSTTRLAKPMYIQQLQVRPPYSPQPRRVSGDDQTSRVEDMGRQYVAMMQPQGEPPSVPLPPPPPPPPSRHNSGLGHDRALISRSGTSTPRSQPGLEVAPMMPERALDTGLIPVDDENSPERVYVSLSPRDCTIGPGSSFYLYKGFCDGAKDVVRGNIGVKKAMKPGFHIATTVARCTGCLFELDFSQIETDLNKEDKGNFVKSGIQYRLRFLQKSHLPAKRVDDVLYACVFCVQAGRTVDESDPTVFTTTKALFKHLTHHPRPLPEVPGVAVVDGGKMPDHLRNDYDIYFGGPPEAHPAQLNLNEIIGRATGVTKEHSRRIYGQRLLFDRSPALELCHGAKVTGITWPDKYNGDWIFAWHDGVYASAPADIFKLDPPPSEEIRMVGSSLTRAKSRWKFAQKEKDKDKSIWLTFGKNEAITNISYPYPEHWCWSGTNSKGKWGIFPKAFLDPSTVQELTVEGADRALTLSNEKNKSSSMLGMFSIRRPSGRPASVASSSSSHETLAQYYGSRFPRANRATE